MLLDRLLLSMDLDNLFRQLQGDLQVVMGLPADPHPG